MHTIPAGVGLGLEDLEGYIQVIKVIRGSSAHEKGISVGDRLLKVDGVVVNGMNAEFVARNLIVGTIGSAVRIELSRRNGRFIETVRYLLFRKVLNPADVSSTVSFDDDFLSNESFSPESQPECFASILSGFDKDFHSDKPKLAAPSHYLDRIVQMSTTHFHTNGSPKEFALAPDAYPGKFLHIRGQFTPSTDHSRPPEPVKTPTRARHSALTQGLSAPSHPWSPAAPTLEPAPASSADVRERLQEARRMHAATVLNERRLLRRAAAAVSRWSVLSSLHREAAVARAGRQRRAHETLAAHFDLLAAHAARRVRDAAALASALARRRRAVLSRTSEAWHALLCWPPPDAFVGLVIRAAQGARREECARRQLAALSARRQDGKAARTALSCWARHVARRAHLAATLAAAAAAHTRSAARTALQALAMSVPAAAARSRAADNLRGGIFRRAAMAVLAAFRGQLRRPAVMRLAAWAGLLRAAEERQAVRQARSALVLVSWCVAAARASSRRAAIDGARTAAARRAAAAALGALRRQAALRRRRRRAVACARATASGRIAAAVFYVLRRRAQRRQLGRLAAAAGARAHRVQTASEGLAAFAAAASDARLAARKAVEKAVRLTGQAEGGQTAALSRAAGVWRDRGGCGPADAVALLMQGAVLKGALRGLRRAALRHRLASVARRDLAGARARRAARAALTTLELVVALGRAGSAARRLVRNSLLRRMLQAWFAAPYRNGDSDKRKCGNSESVAVDHRAAQSARQGRQAEAAAAAAAAAARCRSATAALAALGGTQGALVAERRQQMVRAVGLIRFCNHRWDSCIGLAWASWLSLAAADLCRLPGEAEQNKQALAIATAASRRLRLRTSLRGFLQWKFTAGVRRAVAFRLVIVLYRVLEADLGRALGGLRRTAIKRAEVRNLKVDLQVLSSFNAILQHFDAWRLRAQPPSVQAGGDANLFSAAGGGVAPRCLHVASVRAAENMVRSGLVPVDVRCNMDTLAPSSSTASSEDTETRAVGCSDLADSALKCSKTSAIAAGQRGPEASYACRPHPNTISQFRRACESVLGKAESILTYTSHLAAVRSKRRASAWFKAIQEERSRFLRIQAQTNASRCKKSLLQYLSAWQDYYADFMRLETFRLQIEGRRARGMLVSAVHNWNDVAGFEGERSTSEFQKRTIHCVFQEWQELLFLSVYRQKVHTVGLISLPSTLQQAVFSRWKQWAKQVNYEESKLTTRLMELIQGCTEERLKFSWLQWSFYFCLAKQIHASRQKRFVTQSCAVLAVWKSSTKLKKRIEKSFHFYLQKWNDQVCRLCFENWILLFNHNHSLIFEQILPICNGLELNIAVLHSTFFVEWASYNIVTKWSVSRSTNRDRSLLLDAMAGWILHTRTQKDLDQKMLTLIQYRENIISSSCFFFWNRHILILNRMRVMSAKQKLQLSMSAMIIWYRFLRIENMYTENLSKFCLECLTLWRAYVHFDKRLKAMQLLSSAQRSERILNLSCVAWIQHFLTSRRQCIISEEISRRHDLLIITVALKSWISLFQHKQYISLIERKISLFGIGTLLSRIVSTWSNASKSKKICHICPFIFNQLSELTHDMIAKAFQIWHWWSALMLHQSEVLLNLLIKRRLKILSQYMERFVTFIIKRKYYQHLRTAKQAKMKLSYLILWNSRMQTLKIIEQKFEQHTRLSAALMILEWNEISRLSKQVSYDFLEKWIDEITDNFNLAILTPLSIDSEQDKILPVYRDDELEQEYSISDALNFESVTPDPDPDIQNIMNEGSSAGTPSESGLGCEHKPDSPDNLFYADVPTDPECSYLRQGFLEWKVLTIQARFFSAAYKKFKSWRNKNLCCQWFKFCRNKSKQMMEMSDACSKCQDLVSSAQGTNNKSELRASSDEKTSIYKQQSCKSSGIIIKVRYWTTLLLTTINVWKSQTETESKSNKDMHKRSQIRILGRAFISLEASAKACNFTKGNKFSGVERKYYTMKAVEVWLSIAAHRERKNSALVEHCAHAWNSKAKKAGFKSNFAVRYFFARRGPTLASAFIMWTYEIMLYSKRLAGLLQRLTVIRSRMITDLVLSLWLEYQLRKVHHSSVLAFLGPKADNHCMKLFFSRWAGLQNTLNNAADLMYAAHNKLQIFTFWIGVIRSMDVTKNQPPAVISDTYSSSTVLKVKEKQSLWTRWEETNYGQSSPVHFNSMVLSGSDIFVDCETGEVKLDLADIDMISDAIDNFLDCEMEQDERDSILLRNTDANTKTIYISTSDFERMSCGSLQDMVVHGNVSDQICPGIDTDEAKKLRASKRRARFLQEHSETQEGNTEIFKQMPNDSIPDLHHCSGVAYLVAETGAHFCDDSSTARNRNPVRRSRAAAVVEEPCQEELENAVLELCRRRNLYFLNMSLLKWQEQILRFQRLKELQRRIDGVCKYKVIVAWMQHHSVQTLSCILEMKRQEGTKLRTFVSWSYSLRIRKIRNQNGNR